MKKIRMLCFVFWLSVYQVKAESYCIMGGNDGEVYEEKDMHTQQSVASISKIMTAILAIEHGNLDDTWDASENILQSEGSSLYLSVGQKVSMRSLLYGLMLRSGNDAAIEIATHISGSMDAFVDEMNQKAKELEMNNTLFHNPSGLDEADGGNLSTAYDMALLMRYAMQNPIFKEITGSKYYSCEWNLRWKNKNRLLFDYPNTTGGKTGFTKKAGRTLVTSATHQGLDSIVVSLAMADDFKFHQDAHEKTFETHTPYTLIKKGTYIIGKYEYQIEEDVVLSLSNDIKHTLDVHSKENKGTLVVEIQLDDHMETYEYKGEKTNG